nr:hypothetical protein [Actinomycetota bacterium]
MTTPRSNPLSNFGAPTTVATKRGHAAGVLVLAGILLVGRLLRENEVRQQPGNNHYPVIGDDPYADCGAVATVNDCRAGARRIDSVVRSADHAPNREPGCGMH